MLKITISAIAVLRDKPPGSFIVRNSNTFQGAFGLALKVAQIPPNIQIKEGGLLSLKVVLLLFLAAVFYFIMICMEQSYGHSQLHR